MSFDVPFLHLLGCVLKSASIIFNDEDKPKLAEYIDNHIPDNWCEVIEEACATAGADPDGVKGFIAMYYALGYSLCTDNSSDQATIPDPVIDNEHFNKRFNTIL